MNIKITSSNKTHAIIFLLLLTTAAWGQTTYTVNSTNDADDGLCDGAHCSLREAINAANASAGADIINFSTSGTLTLASVLPALTDNAGVTIDGATATGASANTNLTGALNGTLAFTISGANTYTVGLTVSSDNNIIKMLNFINVGAAGTTDVMIDITAGADNNQVLGCYIGTDINGTASSGGGTEYGIRITDGANNQTGDGTAAGRNLISGLNTSGFGVFITGPSSTGNTIKGNMIGLQKDGATFLATTQLRGVQISSSATGNTIGGTVSGEGNVISGNRNSGVFLNSAAGNTVLGNIIGPQANGTSNVGSNAQVNGVNLSTGSNNIIGGNTVGARNIISANLTNGILFWGASSSGNIVKGNYIGLDINGTTFIAGSSQTNGVNFTLASANNTIGGDATLGEGNVISGNNTYGIYTNALSSAGNSITGNIIGPQANGTSNVSNDQDYGIAISGSRYNTIGGNTAGARNIISANSTYGVYITVGTSTGNSVKGNYIGIDKNGTTFIAGSTQDWGVYITGGAASNTIGGDATLGEGNVISGASNATGDAAGIWLASSAGNTVVGNIIGPRANGTSSVTANDQDNGIYINASPNNTIGGNTVGARNVIFSNTVYGVYIIGAGATGNSVKGNYLGIGSNGTSASTGQFYGVYFTTSAASNTIGGSGAGEGNVISGNTNAGVYNVSSAAVGNTVLGNIIGPQANGTGNVTANAQIYGVYLSSSPNNTIGGNTAGAKNIISANTTYGVYITGAASTGNSVKGNYIGLDINGTTFIASSSQDYGVYITTSAAGNTIGGTGAGEGNVISGASNTTTNSAGIWIVSAAAAGNSVLGNIIGPQANGTSYLASQDQDNGIVITSSLNNTIGGNTAGARNIISANSTYGVYITGATSTGNSVKGNYIGLDINGTTFIASSTQDWGVYFFTSAGGGNTIGGAGAGEGNVISGASNTTTNSAGIWLASTGATGNSVLGNIIGPQANGTSSVAANDQDNGIYISSSRNNTIGGSTSGARNIISANSTYGVYITGATSTGNSVKGNYIGSDINGTTFITGSSQNNGVYITSLAASNTIGGSGAGEGNVISGNSSGGAGTAAGVFTNSLAAAGNSVLGNIIGPQANGTSYFGANDQSNGITISGSVNNIIGGSAAGAKNTISANLTRGIYITVAGSTGNSVRGNYIGIDQTGTTVIIPNQANGIEISSTAGGGNTIGGDATLGEGNVISGNDLYGINLAAAAGNSVLGNIIGPQADGTSYLATQDQDYGVIIGSSPNNIIGGNSAAGRNIISANKTGGVGISSAGSTGNIVKGNYIGIDKNGTTFITGSTQDYGVNISTSAAGNTIGGTGAGEGNVISGASNATSNSTGILLNTTTSGNSVLGNIIGLQANGTSYLASQDQDVGVYIFNSYSNTIGGNSAGARNIISGNTSMGIYISGASATSNAVQGNYIGTDINGTTFVTGSSQSEGVSVQSFAKSNTIGGTGVGEGNVISGNILYGVFTSSTDAAGNSALGNIIGPRANGTSILNSLPASYQNNGVYISNSPNNTIGGSAAGTRNVISANRTYGVYITGASSTSNSVKGNYIGPGSSLANITGSDQDYGVYFTGSPASNTVGGSAAGEANEIAFNTAEGVYLTSALTDFNLISRNPIYSNAVKPINLNYGMGANNDKAIPVITTANTTTVVGTSAAGDIVEVFKNSTGNCNDAASFVGSATADGAGNWSLSVSLADSDYVLATARDASNNTSEFTSCQALPVELLYFNAQCTVQNNVLCQWATASEINNDFFTVERAEVNNGILQDWKIVDTVNGAGNSSTIRSYEFSGPLPPIGGEGWGGSLYYRLKQTDYNGRYEYFGPVSVTCETGDEWNLIFQNPTAGNELTGTLFISDDEEVQINLFDLHGKKVVKENIFCFKGANLLRVDLKNISSGIYFLKVYDEKKQMIKKIVKL